jgi:streptomycin 6-kinase
MNELRIPRRVVDMVTSADGEAGRRWLAELPGIVDRARRRWLLELAAPFEGGNFAYVAPATLPGGSAAVLKVSLVDEETRHEADALTAWAGNGAVRLLDADPAEGALLLERLVPGTSLEEHPDRDEAVGLGCGVLRRLWVDLPPGHPFAAVSELASRWARELPERHLATRVLDDELVGRAVDACLALSRETATPVLVNRDFHLGNVLSATREPWLAIDPKPLAGEPVFDTGHLLRSLLPRRPERKRVHELAHRLAAELEVDAEAVRAWALVRSVEDALWSLETGLGDPGRDIYVARILSSGRPRGPSNERLSSR